MVRARYLSYLDSKCIKDFTLYKARFLWLRLKESDDSRLSGLVVDALDLAGAINVKVSDYQIFGFDEWLGKTQMLVKLLAIEIGDSVLNQVVTATSSIEFVNRPAPGVRPDLVVLALEEGCKNLARVVLHFFIQALIPFCNQLVGLAQHGVEWFSGSVLDSVQG